MLKTPMAVALSLALCSQGIVHAEQPDAAAPADMAVERVNRTSLATHIDAMEIGDRVAVVTDDGVVAGELVDKDADDIVIDQPRIEGGNERVAIPRREIQAMRYASQNPPSVQPAPNPSTIKTLVIAGVIVGTLLLLRGLFAGP
jgi:hypothetical protein